MFIQTILGSVADTVLAPMQDVLGLGSEARMNLPGRPDGNWRWRLRPEQMRPDDAERLSEMVTDVRSLNRRAPMTKPRLSFWQIWNMSFGFLGIQFGWGLQMANMSAIYEYLGARAGPDPDAVARRAADRACSCSRSSAT